MATNDDDAIAKVVAGILSFPLLILLRAWVLTLLWGWFVTPFGLMSLGLAHAYGLSTVAQLFTFKGMPATDKTKDQSWWVMYATSIAVSLVFLGFGAVAHAFM